MLGHVINFFKAKTSAGKTVDSHLIDSTYKYWRIRTMYAMYVGYAAFYFTRKSFTFVIPEIIKELHFNAAEIGLIGSVFYITYGISKFISGMLSDRSNPRYFMAVGLLMTGLANIFFGFSSSLVFLTLFWFFNGFFQGWGWPPCACLLTHWYSRSERGFWWGIWNTSHNLGGALIPLLMSWAVLYFGNWRFAMLVPSVIAIVLALFVINRLRGTPESLGLPTIEAYKNDYSDGQKETTQKKPIIEIFFLYVLKNKYVWILAFSSVLVYIIRTALNDWGTVYLTERGYDPDVARGCVSFFEVGGFIGSLVAGFCSDKLFRGKRGQTNVLFSLGVLLVILAFCVVTENNSFLHASLMFGSGFFIFGPQMLIGTAAAELSHRESAGTATGFVGLFAYIGAALSGYPVGAIIHHFGWHGFFLFLAGCGVLSILLLLPLWGAAGYKKA
jgi:MFS transporter, OPA family, sugar phosphate sensor protein UhpC